MRKIKLTKFLTIFLLLLLSGTASAQITISKYTKTTADDLQVLKNIQDSYNLSMILNKNLESYFSFEDFEFIANGEIKSYVVRQWKGISVIDFVHHKITTADKDNGISKSMTLDMRVTSGRKITVDIFPGKPPIINLENWVSFASGPVTPTADFINGKWRFQGALFGSLMYFYQSNKSNYEIEKIEKFRKLNLLQLCKNDSCIVDALNQFK